MLAHRVILLYAIRRSPSTFFPFSFMFFLNVWEKFDVFCKVTQLCARCGDKAPLRRGLQAIFARNNPR